MQKITFACARRPALRLISLVCGLTMAAAASAQSLTHAPDPMFQTCFALVGSTMFGRAVSSVFIGLNPPRVPTRMFATFQEALSWIRQTPASR
jgi:hypothetical protein